MKVGDSTKSKLQLKLFGQGPVQNLVRIGRYPTVMPFRTEPKIRSFSPITNGD